MQVYLQLPRRNSICGHEVAKYNNNIINSQLYFPANARKKIPDLIEDILTYIIKRSYRLYQAVKVFFCNISNSSPSFFCIAPFCEGIGTGSAYSDNIIVT